jgi:hypothetical protein
MSEEMARAARGAASRLRSAWQDLEQILAAPGEFPAVGRQALDAIADDIVVALRRLRTITERLR